MTLPSFNVRVSTVRSQNPQGRGGAIFTGIEVDEDGARRDAKSHLVVKAPRWLLGTSVEVGQLWRVTGHATPNTIIVNGYRMTEQTLVAEALDLLRPSGEHIVTMLAESDAFAGIGRVKARRLWDHFGEALYDILDAGDVGRLKEAMTDEAAQNLAAAWRTWGDTFTLQWLQAKGFPVALGRQITEHFSPDAASKIEANPYRLISFAANWATTDKLAREAFHIAEDDPRRLAGAVEEALYGAFDAGHTRMTSAALADRIGRLLKCQDRALIERAIAEAEKMERFLRRGDYLHAAGPYVLESSVAEYIAQRASSKAPLLDAAVLSEMLSQYQAESGITLEPHQAAAIRLANDSAFGVITGGAGTGKTTVLRAIFELCRRAGLELFAMALSGKAARRIGEATGHPSVTIAGFLTRFDAGTAPDRALVVIDESSMVDLLSAYRLIRHLPDSFRILLVGDPNQLPPVGPGLVLHEIAPLPGLPHVELQKVKRYGGIIAESANAIRHGQWPDIPDSPSSDIAFIPCELAQINDTVLELLTRDPDGTQILCPTRTAVAGGVTALNALCLQALHGNNAEATFWNHEYESIQGTGLRVGSPVICLKNDWEKNLQNGSLGVILSVEPPSREAAPGQRIAVIRWDDGKERDLTPELLPHLELAYAITVHKAQGSQWPRVIIPVRHSRILDRTLLYTGITRTQQQVILVGDVAAAKAAAEAPASASRRQVGLGSMLQELL